MSYTAAMECLDSAFINAPCPDDDECALIVLKLTGRCSSCSLLLMWIKQAKLS
jgi:hypothetical protein